jgi:hypothetical protein
MLLSQVRKLLVRAANIQSTIKRETRAHRQDWLRQLRLQRTKLAIAERLYRLACVAMPGHVEPRLVPVIASTGRRHSWRRASLSTVARTAIRRRFHDRAGESQTDDPSRRIAFV